MRTNGPSRSVFKPYKVHEMVTTNTHTKPSNKQVLVTFTILVICYIRDGNDLLVLRWQKLASQGTKSSFQRMCLLQGKGQCFGYSSGSCKVP